MSSAGTPTEVDAFRVDFPADYPEIIEQMGQIIGRRLVGHGLPTDAARALAYEIAEAIRTEIGGTQQYIPRGLQFDLSRRDEEIYREFTGNNYHVLARQYHLTEMQVRNICKRGLARDKAARQFSLLE